LVKELLRRRPPPSISAVNLAEAIDVLIRIDGREQEAVRDRVDWLIAGGLEIEPVWLHVARSAAAIRAQHYHRSQAPISNADAMCVATAISLKSDLATSDPDLAIVARSLGVEVIPLPDSAGRPP
jgi:predicted nucleic acid-binding protein